MRRLLSLLSFPLVGCLLCLSPSAWATTYNDLDLPTMLAAGDLVFYGTVSELSVAEEEGEVWTVVTFDVLETLRGGDETSRVLRFYGAPEEAVTVVGMPRFAVGETVLVLAYDAPYYSPIVGFNQGLWRLGVRGFEDVRGRLLSVGEDGALALTGEGGDDAAILTALRLALEESR